MVSEGDREPLAIVGIGCRLPGDVGSPEEFWRLLCDETDATRDVPETRWSATRYFDPNPAKAGKMVTRRGGYLSEIDQFDAQFFGISPREANLLDPQQRLLLQTTWEALEDGGLPAEDLAGTDVGVFVGGFTLDYQLLQNQGRTSRYRFKTHSATGMMMTMLANRLSYAYDLRGPSMTVDTACSSSLVAVHLAAQAIWNGECHLALAGGVNVIIGPSTAIAESKSGFLSPDGRCKAFDESADGYARAEGGAVVLIKPLADALRDGDGIYAQLLGTAVSQDGRTDGITVPREEAQGAAITTALRRAGIAPREVGYVEAHGTGTPVGDPVEMRALAGALAFDRPAGEPLLIGSVKTNIGHLEAGAGVAGLIKTALVLKHGYVPANLHLHHPSTRIPFAELNVEVPRTGRPFPAGGRRIAGVNSFGFGGTNAHVVLAEPPAPVDAPAPTADRRPPLTLLPISARSEEALVATADRLAGYVEAHPDTSLADLGYTLGRRRSHLNHRRALVVSGIDDVRSQLAELAAGAAPVSSGRTATPPKVAFVCTGMGPQWWRMCRGLLDEYPAFADSIARTDRELSRYADWSVLDELRRDEADSRMARTDVAQPANFAVQVALAEQLRAFGIHPDAVIGHSAGEVAAHHLAGLLTFEQAVHVIHHRSRLQQRTTGMGRMLAVGLGADALMDHLDAEARARFGHEVSVAAINSPFAVTVAGDADALAGIAKQLDRAEVFHRFLPVEVPYHTHYMDLVRDELYDAFAGLSSASATVPLYSTVTGDRLTEYAAGAAYWWQNTRATVLFEPAVRQMLDDGYTHFVELGPHPVLASSILETAGARRVSTIAAQRRNDDDGRTLMSCVAHLYGHGRDVDWAALHPRAGARLLRLPSYPWQTKRFWNENPEAAEELHYRPVHPLLGQPVDGVHPTWEAELSTATLPFLSDHRVQGTTVVPGAVFVEMAMAAATEAYGAAYAVDDLVLHRALILDDACDPLVRTTLDRDRGTLEFAAFTPAGTGDFAWTLTATAELNVLGRPPAGGDATDETGETGSLDGAEFYDRTVAMAFDYGEAFRPITSLVAGTDWARAELAVPAPIADELDAYGFHPALVDGAFQTLFGATFTGGGDGTFVPTRIRRCAVYGPPEEKMTVSVRVVSATGEQIESDVTVASGLGEPLAVFTGFTVRSLSASSATSTDRIDRGLYEICWEATASAGEPETGDASWLVLADASGVGTAVADRLRRLGRRVTVVDSGYAIDPALRDQFEELVQAHLAQTPDLAGIVDCWPLDVVDGADAEVNHRLGVFAVLHLMKALAACETGSPRVHLVTANAQPIPGSELLAVEQAAIWGLGRVIGHQEAAANWGGLVDVDTADDRTATAARICRHLLADGPEDQVALRGDTTFVPRLRPCAHLRTPFPTKLTADAAYVVTGGGGALGRSVATHLAERGARHVVLLNRTAVPPRARWDDLAPEDPAFATVATIGRIERLGTRVTTAAVDVTDAEQVRHWLADHLRDGGRPVRGIVHAAGSVEDRLLINMTEDDFTRVLAPKVAGTRVLHDVFDGHDLEFFVMFGSAGSVIASPGQGNYAAANAVLDAFAHYRRARGLPALTIGWGPWSVGMVEELGLEKVYERRGIELITPAAGSRILDRLLHQSTPAVVAISADWNKARQFGLGGALPPMLAGLETVDASPEAAEAGSSVLAGLADLSPAERLDVVTDHVRRIVATVFDSAVADVEPDESLDDLGLDSMMAMEFRLRINATFAIDLPVLEILRGVSVTSLSHRVLAKIELPQSDSLDETPAAADVDELIAGLSEADLRELLAELEGGAGDPEPQP
ncbi:mycocerosic acid synthase [Mycolicibacterium madagascariense]|uniref:Mycocerosic acid synthase n=2 Tax=Mycolicibacterium madagascariense TaxID=212765 RepID=A0A7I7X8T3_9MYCO|nr:type I polyketide synthase [Mycolicibacterium madagascariense]BBZ25964.1 mycocerosic acid synthase [Mycolicibacterium madagascariense]